MCCADLHLHVAPPRGRWHAPKLSASPYFFRVPTHVFAQVMASEANAMSPSDKLVAIEAFSARKAKKGGAEGKPLECRRGGGSMGGVDVERDEAGEVVSRNWKGYADQFFECPEPPTSI